MWRKIYLPDSGSLRKVFVAVKEKGESFQNTMKGKEINQDEMKSGKEWMKKKLKSDITTAQA